MSDIDVIAFLYQKDETMYIMLNSVQKKKFLENLQLTMFDS